MKRTGIIHAELARRIAALRHTDTFVVCDAGLPLRPDTPCIDLGYRYGQATFADVTATVLGEVVVEHSWMSADVATVSPHVHRHVVELGLAPELIEHGAFKAAVLDAAFAVRTGEDTFFANVLCRAGVPFG
ncbi:D-ribose pyranase [Mycolicibacterium madagascariense]|uniref:D-ribose pyranase n=1 Tax=Mycolicibacterium madagascariense TaxID=212765 RepID=A0A7I7XG23_9MYCO|nr:D-ribose pyranase [Mycolicibacterium madagascariense]MCV7013842.1 D-ribose pyranase [Mycolicibacterium madagascariense]BBZ28121.1 D-ribose pyranase [Mycolicibacterium madagascariense]